MPRWDGLSVWGLDLRLLAPWSPWPILSEVVAGTVALRCGAPFCPGTLLLPRHASGQMSLATGRPPGRWLALGLLCTVGCPQVGLPGRPPWEEEGLPWTGLLLSLSGSSEDPLLA